MESRKRFDWLPAEMPVVTDMVRRNRRQHGDAHVNECWKRGVINGEPGWFFAREGTLAIGTPWKDDPVMVDLAAYAVPPKGAILLIRTPGAMK